MRRDHWGLAPDPIVVERLVMGDLPASFTQRERREAVATMMRLGVPRRVIAERLRISVQAARRCCCRINRDGVWGRYGRPA